MSGDDIFLWLLFIVAVLFFGRSLVKKNFCPKIFGDSSSDSAEEKGEQS